MRLNNRNKNLLRGASSERIKVALERLHLYTKRDRWLGVANSLFHRLKSHKRKNHRSFTSLNQKHVEEYVASSVPLHCIDSWSFLGRALLCSCVGDPDRSRHFAYYAELRAAMALLASQGIGIFIRKHVVIDDQGNAHWIGGYGTHEFTWQALNHWAGLSRSGELLLRCIRPDGIPLIDWFNYFSRSGVSGSVTQIQPIASKWFKTWGIDIKRLTEDRYGRNDASYRPSFSRAKPKFSDSISYSSVLWRICEPSANSPFNNLDRYLLRLSLEEAFYSITGRSVKEYHPEYSEWIENTLSGLNINADSIKNEWLRFFQRKTDYQDPPVIEGARGEDLPDSPSHHFQVMSRALLLVRVATFVVSEIMSQTNFDKKSLEFWWKDIGLSCALWPRTVNDVSFIDLWNDASESIESIEDWLSNSNSNDLALAHKALPHELIELTKCERAFLWGLELG